MLISSFLSLFILLNQYQLCVFYCKSYQKFLKIYMKLYAYQSNERFRNIRKKQFNLHSQQKNTFKDLFKLNPHPNFQDIDFYRTVVFGVPSEYRSIVWSSLIFNYNLITEQFYSYQLHKLGFNQDLLIKSNAMEGEQEEESGMDRSSIATIDFEGSPQTEEGGDFFENKVIGILGTIQKDLPRTFPDLRNLHQDSSECLKLMKILGTVAISLEEIGYVQGMSHIAAILLLELNNDFICFSAMMNMLSSTPLKDFFTFKQSTICSFSYRVSERVKKISPEVWDLLAIHAIDYRMLVVNWVMTLFSRCFQIDSILNVWDILLANRLSYTVLVELCSAVIASRKSALFELNDAGKIAKTLIHGKLNLIEEEWVLEYMRELARMV